MPFIVDPEEYPRGPHGDYQKLLIGLIVGLILFLSIVTFANIKSVHILHDVQIESIERSELINGYLVFTDHGVLENRANVIFAKFDAETLHHKLQKAGSCTLEVNLVDSPLFSLRRNIIRAECTPP